MWRTALVVTACVLGLIALAFVVGAPMLAVPIVIAGVVAIGAFDVHRRRKQEKRTLVPK